MARYELVKDVGAPHGNLWGIEEVIPGQKPVEMDFTGTRAEAEAELHHLNLFGVPSGNGAGVRKGRVKRQPRLNVRLSGRWRVIAWAPP
jgi:hypothetical protein